MRWRGLSSVIAAFLVIVGSWKGYLALFDPGKQEPKQIFPGWFLPCRKPTRRLWRREFPFGINGI